MPSIEVNGETVHLHLTTLRDFQRFTEITFVRLKAEASIRETIGLILFDALRQGQTVTDKVVQTVLWALHDLGVGSVSIDFEKSTMQMDKVVDTDASRGDGRAITVGSIETGRAYVVALANVSMRSIGINGEVVRAFPQPKEALQRMSQQIQANRLVNEDLVFTACRAVGAMIKQGKTIADEDYRAAVEVVAGLGVFSLVVDLERQRLAIREFSEGNAASAALLQGADAKQIQQIRERIGKARAQLEDLKAKMAAGEIQPGLPPKPAMRGIVPPVIGGRRSTRRRG